MNSKELEEGKFYEAWRNSRGWYPVRYRGVSRGRHMFSGMPFGFPDGDIPIRERQPKHVVREGCDLIVSQGHGFQGFLKSETRLRLSDGQLVVEVSGVRGRRKLIPATPADIESARERVGWAFKLSEGDTYKNDAVEFSF